MDGGRMFVALHFRYKELQLHILRERSNSPNLHKHVFADACCDCMMVTGTHRDRWPAKVISVLTGGHVDNDSTVSVRFNGRCFRIHMSPNFLRNSPSATKQYLKHLEAIQPDGPGEFDGVTDEDVYAWLIQLFSQLFRRLAPEPLPQFDPDAIRAGSVVPLLSDYLVPQTYGCRLEAVDEELVPLHMDDHGGLMTPCTWLDADILDDLETWTSFFEPTNVEVCFAKPEHALDRMPTRVKVVADASKPTMCFFKEFGTGVTGGPLNRELDVYRNIQKCCLGDDVLVGRLVGVVHEHEHDSILGLLLRYIDHDRTLYYAVMDQPSPELRSRWAAQISRAVHELHRIGSVWGDVKPDNVLIDREDNAWITDFEGGYTPGWVEPDMVGTVEGDLEGLQRITQYIFQEDTDEWPDASLEDGNEDAEGRVSRLHPSRE